MHSTRSPQERHATKLEKPRRFSSSMVCSPLSSRSLMASSRRREKVDCLRVSRNSCRMSIISTCGMGRCSMRSGNSSSLNLPLLGVVAGFETGRRGAENHHGVGGLRPHDGDIAAVIARRLRLLVAAVVLFVHHHQAEILHGREDAGARADHHARIAGANAAPLFGALDFAESGMQDRHPVAEAVEELARHGGRERDLGNQQQRAASVGETRVDGAQVDFGLPGPGDAVQQEMFGTPAAASERSICW